MNTRTANQITHHINFQIQLGTQSWVCEEEDTFHNDDSFRMHHGGHRCPGVCFEIVRRQHCNLTLLELTQMLH